MKVTFLTESYLAELIQKKEDSQQLKEMLRELKESVERDAERFGKNGDMKVNEES